MKMRALWWWIDRWRKSTAFMDMTLEQQGAYRNLLDEAALRGGPLPNDDRILAKACGDATAWKRIRDVVMARFTLAADGWRNETLDSVLAVSSDIRTTRSESGRRGAEKRWQEHGKRDGKTIANTIARHVAHDEAKDPAKGMAPDPDPISLVLSEPKKNSGRLPNARSKRPIFTGQRLTVFEWMLDDIGKMLGAHFDGFDCHSWFLELDTRATAAGMVIPQRDGGAWLLAETLLEARRRGLPIAVTNVPSNGKLTSRLAAALEEIQAEDPS